MVLLDDMNKAAEPTPQYHDSDSTLLKKFDIPLSHLDYEYVDKCGNADELEKILQILKSGEEGYFPQLIERTERKLMEIRPNSKYLRKMVQILKASELDKDNYKQLTEDICDWLEDIKKKNEELEALRNKNSNKEFPEVRKNKQVQIEENKQAPSRIKSTDYSAWDKYDVETELLKMDLEDKKTKLEAEKKAKVQIKKASVKFNPFATTAEATFEAQRENEKANEYFKAKEYDNSIECYTNSIAYYSNPVTFKNRAAAYMALKKYDNAISDLKEALKYDANDFEVHLRIGQCYQNIKKYEEAAVFTETAIRINPNDKNVQKLAETIKKKFKSEPHKECGKVRMKVSDVRGNDIEEKKKENTKKSILKKEDKVIVPIPGTSKMPGPYYKVVNRSDIEIKNRNSGKIKPKVEYEDNKINEKINKPEPNKIDKKLNKSVKENDQTMKMLITKADDILVNNQIDKPNLESKKPKIIELEESVKDIKAKVNNQSTRKNNSQIKPPQKIEIQMDLNAGGEPFTDNTHALTPEQIQLPYSFMQAWLGARKEPNYLGFAPIIKHLNTQRLTEVVGNKLDATMLQEIINCLYRHFTVANEVDTVYNFLRNLYEVNRFNLIIMFLTNEDKTLLKNLINFLKQHGKKIPNEILRQYNLH